MDHNKIGTAGLAILAGGLAQNSVLERLSLNYCEITSDGSKYLQQILANVNSKLYKLKMIGNLLRNEGTYELFRALEISNILERVNLSDNQFHSDVNDPTLINKIIDTMQHNTTLGYYNLSFNNMSDEDAERVVQCVETNKSIYFIQISDHVSKALQDKLKLLTKRRKPKKKKKSKKKK